MTVDLSYDDASGFYIAGGATVAITRPSPQFLSIQENIGYAWKLPSGSVVDTGFVRSDYTEYYSGERAAHYTEFYAGMVIRNFASHLHYSPDYFRSGVSTLYADVDAAVRPAPDWRLAGHAGLLRQIAGSRPVDGNRTHYDWRLSVARRTGPFDLQIAWSGGGPGQDYYEGRRHDRNAIIVGATYIF